mgnify:CR=1 FL=1
MLAHVRSVAIRRARGRACLGRCCSGLRRSASAETRFQVHTGGATKQIGPLSPTEGVTSGLDVCRAAARARHRQGTSVVRER